jgi:hypothetical protein
MKIIKNRNSSKKYPERAGAPFLTIKGKEIAGQDLIYD